MCGRRKKVCASLHYLNSWNGFNLKEGNRDIRDQQEFAELLNDFFPHDLSCILVNLMGREELGEISLKLIVQLLLGFVAFL